MDDRPPRPFGRSHDAPDDPRECFHAFLRTFWMDNTEEEALALWRLMIRHGSSFPREALRCVDAVLADPPPDLVESMQVHGWLYPVHQPDADHVEPYSYDEHVDWLRGWADRLRAALDELSEGSGA
jgi:hypothetical protein